MDETIITYASDAVQKFWDSLGSWLGDHAFNIAVILFFAWLATRYGGQFLSRVFHKTIRDDLYPTKGDRIKRLETIDSITGAILKVVIFVVTSIMLISEVGINTTPLVASAGVLGIALGVGAQSLIKDFASGVFIIIDNQYRVGDVVKLGDIAGKVEAITIRTTVLRSLDGTLYHVPNGSISATANLTMNYGGIEEDIVFDHDVDIQKLILTIDRVGTEMAADSDLSSMIMEAPHFERVVGFDPNGIKVKIIGTTTTNDSWFIKGELYRRLIVAFRKAGINTPVQKILVEEAKKTKTKK